MNTSADTTDMASTSAGEVATALYAALLTNRLDDARRNCRPDVVLHVPGSHPLSGDHHGPDALVRFVEAGRERTVAGEHFDVIDVLDGTEHAAVYVRVTAERPDKVPLDNTTVHVLRLVDGQVAEVWLHNWDNTAVTEFWS